MKKSRFSETQIAGILKEADAGMPVKDVCRLLEPVAELEQGGGQEKELLE